MTDLRPEPDLDLIELSELHHADPMPAEVRTRVLGRWQAWRSAQCLPAADDRGTPPADLAGESAWARAAQRRAMFRAGAFVLLAAAGVALLAGRLQQSPAPSVSIEPPRMASDAPALAGSESRIAGRLVPGSLQPLKGAAPGPDSCHYHFLVQPTDRPVTVPVRYAGCILPDALLGTADCVEVTISGRLAADGHLDASRILASARPCSVPH